MITRANTPFAVTVVVIGCSTPEEVGRASSGTKMCLLSLVCEWKHAAFSAICTLLACTILFSPHYEKPMLGLMFALARNQLISVRATKCLAKLLDFISLDRFISWQIGSSLLINSALCHFALSFLFKSFALQRKEEK